MVLADEVEVRIALLNLGQTLSKVKGYPRTKVMLNSMFLAFLDDGLHGGEAISPQECQRTVESVLSNLIS